MKESPSALFAFKRPRLQIQKTVSQKTLNFSCLKVTEQLFFALFFSNFSPLYEGWLDALAGSYKGSLIYLLWLKCAKPQLTACLEGIERVSTTTQWECCKFEKSVPFESIKNIRTKYIKHLVYFQLRFSRNIF